MHNIRILILASLALLLSLSYGMAQCYGNPQGSGSACSGTPITLTANSTCGTCTHNWSGNPLAGQNTATATYIYTGTGFHSSMVYPSVSSYNPIAGCSYSDTWLVLLGHEPTLSLPALTNGPWDGDTSKVWVYARSYPDPTYALRGAGPSPSFQPTWTISGGTILTTKIENQLFTTWTDSLWIKWDGSVPGQLVESQVTEHNDNSAFFPLFCNWTPSPDTNAHPALAVFQQPGCVGTAGNFFTYPYANSTYTWSVTNGSIVSGQGTSNAQITMNGNGTVSVVRDSAGTTTTASTSVTPFVPVINLGPDIQICSGSAATITANAGFNSYLWSNGATTPSINVTTAGQYSVIGSINGSCYAYDTINVTLFTVTPPNMPADTHTCTFPVVLDAGAGYASYQWSNGTTTQATSAMGNGSFSVTVTDGNGCSSADTILVVDESVTISLGPDQNFCLPDSLLLTPFASNASTYLWSTGSTTLGAVQVSGIGPHLYWLEGSNSFGCTTRDSVVLTGVNGPTAPNIGPDTTICPGDFVVFDAGSGYASYYWNTFTSNQTINATTPASYSVTVTGANGCAASDTVILSNYNFVAPNLGPDANVCQASTILDAGSGYVAYTWSTGSTAQQITATTGGAYAVTVVDANGCSGADTINLTFANFVVNLGPNMTICQPQSMVLDPQLAANLTYNWSTGATSPTISLSNPGTYTVTLTVSNGLGCSASDTVQVTILPTPAINLGADTLMCRDTFKLLDAGAAFTTYLWNTGATTQSVSGTAGAYSIEATAANGCIARDTIMISDRIDCVFPGDVNYDGIANQMDVLALGVGIGAGGSSRQNASTLWYGQYVPNWSTNIVSGVNMKQADTDGDGFVTIIDTLAISNNFGSTHTRTGSVTTGNEVLEIVPLNSPVAAGGIARFGVYYHGANNSDVDSLHGLALKIQWSMQNLSGQGLQSVAYNNAWFAPTSNQMNFTHLGTNAADIALTRISGVDTSGQGLIMELAFQTDPNIPIGQSISFEPQVILVEGVGVDLQPRTAQVVSNPITVMGPVAIGPVVQAHVRIWPIPADNEVRISVEGQMPQRLQLINMMGQIVLDRDGENNREFVLDVADFPSGSYCIQLQTETGLIVNRILIEH